MQETYTMLRNVFGSKQRRLSVPGGRWTVLAVLVMLAAGAVGLVIKSANGNGSSTQAS